MRNKQFGQDIIKTSFGNIIEWYDFSLYSIFAVEISHAFFPNYTSFFSLLMTYLTFSISFIARPLGSIIFGELGDKLGKQYSVNLTIWCMAIPTIAIGILPSYQQIGNLAPICLVILRLLQGLSLGGQLSGLIAIAVDKPRGIRNSLIGIILAISMFGSLLASGLSLVSYHFFGASSSAGLVWRVPFLFSSILFVIYLELNPKIAKGQAHKNYKLQHVFKQQPFELFYMTLLSAVMGSIYYILYSYSITFMQVHLKISSSKSLFCMNILLLISFCCFFIYGRLADKSANRLQSARYFTLILALFSGLLATSNQFAWLLACFSSMAISYSGISCYLTAMFAEIFAQEYQMTACSLSYSGGAVVAGFSPSIAEIVMAYSKNGLYLLLLSLCFTLFVLLDKIAQTAGYQQFIDLNI